MYKIIKDFISEDDRIELLLEINKIQKNFIKVDEYRKNIKFSSHDYISKIFLKTKEKIINEFNLQKYEFKDKKKFVFINYFIKGATLHKHSHVFDGKNLEVRFNVLINSAAGLGGLPIIKDEKLNINQKDLWIFNACLPHWSEVYYGKVPRIAISYGFHIPISEKKFLRFLGII